jgi:RNA-binding protein
VRRLGTVLHVTPRGMIILRTDKTPPAGAKVVDKKVAMVGKIQDVFGPVNNPYVSVRANDKEAAGKLVGQVLYLYSK